MVWDRGRMTIYEVAPNNHARFALGSVGSFPLVCIGVNPSTAEPAMPDQTLRIVANLVHPPFDSFLMFNLYPQRSTRPKGMHDAADPRR